MPDLVMLVLAVVGLLVIGGLVIAVIRLQAVNTRRTADDDCNAPSVLDPVVQGRSQGVHSAASVRAHVPHPPGPSEDATVPGAPERLPRPGAGHDGAAGAATPTRSVTVAETAVAARSGATTSPDVTSTTAERLRETEEEIRTRRQELDEEARRVRSDLHEQRLDIERREHRLAEREERLDNDQRAIDERVAQLARDDEDLAARRAELVELTAERRRILERVAGLTAEEAKAELVAEMSEEAKRTGAVLARDIERSALEEGEARARKILATVIQRVAAEQTSESVVSVVHLPSDDMKGRVIGREGRNIRAFEQTTGVNLIIDDTPEAVLLSCFDPVRREVGRLALEELVADGRIHPSRIEEAHERCRAEVDRLCQRAGEDAALELGITDLHPQLVFTLGQLRYRTSYGQNVLKHLIESAHIAGMIADELGLDRRICVRAAFLHDVGKALTHEAEGSHALVGAELARKHGEHEDVVHAIEAHHNEVEPRTVEAIVTQAADAISGGRPGARRESLEAYVQRLERLEEIAMSCEGVDKVYAMQAGRELRVMVVPGVVDDIGAQVLARDIAKQIEHELTYPGQIKVTVVRESRATEVAR
jgi:ribonuclease Y